MICDNHSNYPIENMIDAFFISNDDNFMFSDKMYPIIEQYDVIEVKNSSKQVYALTTQLIGMMRSRSGITYILTDDHIDDMLFATFLEYAIVTGNRVVFARNPHEVWMTFLRYSQKETYYILDLR